jgi:Tol biopolymer transport system component
MRRGAWAALALALACQGGLGGVQTSELTVEPIAVAWREPDLARRRAEHLASLDPARAEAEHEARWSQVGVVPLDQVQTVLQDMTRTTPRPAPVNLAPRLALLDPRTREATPVAAARRGSRPQAWSPDRRRLLFSQVEGAYVHLYEYDLDREDVRPVTGGRGAYGRGCYLPDGRVVALQNTIENGNPVSRIVLLGRPGEMPIRLSPGPGDHSPVCAPDGFRVVYVASPTPSRYILYAVDLEGEGERTPQRLGPGREPCFTPDGQVVYSARVGGQWQLWRIRTDGTGRARIGRGVLDETQPSVSPDGRHVAYVVEEDFRRFLYLRRLDGSGDRILFRDGDVEFPVW